MPLYEYRCPNGHDFEQFFRSIGTASSQAECPVCGAIGERRLSPAGLVFKGSGFYITDYGKDGKKAEREAASADKKGDSTAASTKPEPGKSDAAPASVSKSADAAPAKEASKSETPKSSPKTTTSE